MGPLLHRAVWREISSFLNNHEETIVFIGGDFNAIMDKEEKFGGSQILSQINKEFKSWTERNLLTDIPTKNGLFTWNNRRKDFNYIAERLDRFMVKGDLSSFGLDIMAEILPISGSDHFPITLNIVEPTKPFRNAFKCEKMWFLDATFMEHIKKWWYDDRPQGSKMFCFISKMKNLKRKIKEWNKEHFKNIFKTKIKIEEELNLLNNEVISKGMDNNKYIKE